MRFGVIAASALLGPEILGQGSELSEGMELNYCIKYYGNMDAVFRVPDKTLTYSGDGKYLCPRSWDVQSMGGASLRLCHAGTVQHPPFQRTILKLLYISL